MRKPDPQYPVDVQCAGKHPFDSYRLALRILRRQPQHKNDRSPMMIYRCHCGKFHIGHKRDRDKKRRLPPVPPVSKITPRNVLEGDGDL